MGDPIPSVSASGVTVPHNAVPWRVAKNRHPNVDGTDWGWIEGAPGNVCWSDNKTFNRQAAGELVQQHNQWLEDQKTPTIRLIEARERRVKALREYEEAKMRFERSSSSLAAIDADIAAIEQQEPSTNDR